MRKIFYTLSLALAILACKQEPKNYVTLSGVITNPNSDSLCVAQRSIIKTIKVNPDGSFSDTLKVEAGNYLIYDGKERSFVYLKNGYDLNIEVDTKAFDESIKYTGVGSEANNFLVEKGLLKEELIKIDEIFDLDEAEFNAKLDSNEKAFKNLLNSVAHLDSAFVAGQETEIEKIKSDLTAMYKQNQALLALKGQESPKFTDYENFDGGNTSLDDLKGKYVYIDLWATWCGPCKQEIPFLKAVEKQYHDKNIAFVSISLDRNSAYETWRKMIEDKELSGIQLFAKEDNSFAKAYIVSGIPRFILIDPAGIVVDADAPRPSSSKLIDLFKTLDI
ncbi:TlpA family protein disulfide reductase [Aestuariibaculum sediminum]|uniref:TlpA family protein disulfide reductase n=1 Tax=Aestuariibaculum sediminum TaxID=2770637 RepID=A0A8J6QAG7_9FLAO|nr:TlpA disulfide reductase family protein [Aestuariibaculum sediminum]MBD0833457.1 TlpA family protein disulfide reductase [Aestuariibaculum sediminum]